MLAYFTILARIMPFWSMRFVARNGKGAAKTGVLANLAISIATTLIHLPLLPLITSALGVREYISIYMIITAQIIELHLLRAPNFLT